MMLDWSESRRSAGVTFSFFLWVAFSSSIQQHTHHGNTCIKDTHLAHIGRFIHLAVLLQDTFIRAAARVSDSIRAKANRTNTLPHNLIFREGCANGVALEDNGKECGSEPANMSS